VHDAFAPYARYPAARHALCNAHLLRELTFLVERAGQAWAGELIELLLELKGRVAEAVDQARVICFLASRDADFVTGVTIDVTGGV